MKYLTQKNIIIALVVIGIAALGWILTKSSTPQETAQEETTAIPETIATSTTQEIATPTEEKEQPKTPTNNESSPTTQPKLQFSFESQPIQKIELGPRQKATVSPRAALEYFVEAIQAGDIDRAVSYFSESVREGYRSTFKEYAEKGAQHPVVTAYLTGTVGDVELIQPQHGIYEILVTPAGSKEGYTLNFFFENGEFVIWEL